MGKKFFIIALQSLWFLNKQKLAHIAITPVHFEYEGTLSSLYYNNAWRKKPENLESTLT